MFAQVDKLSPEEVLKQHWGYTSFRPYQREIIKAIEDGQDVLAVLPTGGGKSLCYQLPALLRPGLCLVVSPLVALMHDQVNQLNLRGIPAHALWAGLRQHERSIILQNCVKGKIKLLYVAPERLQSKLFQENLKQLRINLLAIDEAHCISQWGHDFRPAYRQLLALKPYLVDVPTLALTATATPAVQRDIKTQLDLQKPFVAIASCKRPNLTYRVHRVEDKQAHLLQLCKQLSGTGIIYVYSRRDTHRLQQYLAKHELPGGVYHAGLSHAVRKKRQADWTTGKLRFLVATSAFGMGIDKANVRWIVHATLPSTLEAYYQEAGRAGRDGKPAQVIWVYQLADIQQLVQRIQSMHPSKVFLQKVYQHLADHYQISIGSHAGITYPFDLMHFAHKYNLSPIKVYQAMKRLEEAGLLHVGDALAQAPKLYIRVTSRFLYQFRLANPAYDTLLQALLRLYSSALFQSYCPISYQRIATYLGIPIAKVVSKLTALQKQQIIDYVPASQNAHLTFLVARPPTAQLPIDIKKLHKRATLAKAKMQQVIDYVTQSRKCRGYVLCAYFGEHGAQRCNKCDICSDYNLSVGEAHSMWQQKIIAQLRSGPLQCQAIIEAIAPLEPKSISRVIRNMVDSGTLTFMGPDKLALGQNNTKQ